MTIQPTITNNLYCPVCGQHTRREFTQPLLPGMPIHTYTDCHNAACPTDSATLEITHWLARYNGDIDRQIALIRHLYPWLTYNDAHALYEQPHLRQTIDEACTTLDHFRHDAKKVLMQWADVR